MPSLAIAQAISICNIRQRKIIIEQKKNFLKKKNLNQFYFNDYYKK